MDDILLHPDTRAQLERFLKQPAHALMLLAAEGSGKLTVAETLVRTLLDIARRQAIYDHPGVIHIATDGKSISIDAIRQLQRQLQLKTIGSRPIRRAVIIESAQRMTIEAQNALLKMLEEPPADTVFILTATSTRSVLPTVYSRTQHIELKPPPIEAVAEYFSRHGHSSDVIQRAMRHSGQRLGLSSALLSADAEHPLLTTVSKARDVLGASLFERLQMVDEWSKQKEELPARFDTLSRLCQAGLAQTAEKGEMKLVKRWQRYYQAVYDAQASLAASPNTKLLLTNLFLRLS